MTFVLKNCNNELKLAQNILNDIQNSWGSAFENFIFPYMLENPNEIVKLKKDYHFSVWDFVNFLLDNQNNQNFNRALYEIDKAKKSKDFESQEDEKRKSILQNKSDAINKLNKNRRKCANALFKKSDHLENSWTRKAFWILFAGMSLFIVIATAPLLVIVLMNIGILLADFMLGVLTVLESICVVALGCVFPMNEAAMDSAFREVWSGIPWISFTILAIITPYYCSTFFSVAIVISVTFLIGAIAFYIYKKHQFHSMGKLPNLYMQPEKSPLEKQLDNLKKQFGKQNSPETEKDQYIREDSIKSN